MLYTEVHVIVVLLVSDSETFPGYPDENKTEFSPVTTDLAVLTLEIVIVPVVPVKPVTTPRCILLIPLVKLDKFIVLSYCPVCVE